MYRVEEMQRKDTLWITHTAGLLLPRLGLLVKSL